MTHVTGTFTSPKRSPVTYTSKQRWIMALMGKSNRRQGHTRIYEVGSNRLSASELTNIFARSCRHLITHSRGIIQVRMRPCIAMRASAHRFLTCTTISVCQTLHPSYCAATMRLQEINAILFIQPNNNKNLCDLYI